MRIAAVLVAASAPLLVAVPAEASTPGSVAARFAATQVGKPYVHGGTGRGGYDCSGLTMRAWREAGRKLPHSADAQYRSLPHVRGPLRAGDLIFKVRSRRAYHAAIYAGHGYVIVARHSGTRLARQRLRPYWATGGIKARRPR